MFKNLFNKKEVEFLLAFCGVFLLTVFLLGLLNLLPTEFEDINAGTSPLEEAKLAILGANGSDAPNITAPNATSTQVDVNGTTMYAEEPTRIVITAADVDIDIVNPTSTDVDYLDNELSKGVVHYPGSGMPGIGNMYIFGHSTGFSIVHNQAYKAFNGIHTLKAGDIVSVYSATHIYTYKVRDVKEVSEDDTWVKFDGTTNMLTLSTCDSFGTKSDRYVVEADYVGLQAI